DFTTAARVAEAIRAEFPGAQVEPESSAALQVRMPLEYAQRPVEFVARMDVLTVPTDRRARVVLNERTGTVVIGNDVRIAPLAVLHGTLTVQVVTDYNVSQPAPFSPGQTVVTPQTDVTVVEEEARTALVEEGATVKQLIE